MYATLRRYEGVTDPGEMVRVVNEEGLLEDVLSPSPGVRALPHGRRWKWHVLYHQRLRGPVRRGRVQQKSRGVGTTKQLGLLGSDPPQVTVGEVVVDEGR
jgi:hypothetical protein